MFNKVTLAGHLGADPELRYTTSGDAVCSIRLATSDSWKDKSSGERKEATEWHRLVLYRKLAEIAGEHLKKGALILIEGRIRTRKWTDKDNQERYTTEIEVFELRMLSKKLDGKSSSDETGSTHTSESMPQTASSGDPGDPRPF